MHEHSQNRCAVCFVTGAGHLESRKPKGVVLDKWVDGQVGECVDR